MYFLGCAQKLVCVYCIYRRCLYVLVCNFWTVLYLHDNMVLMWVPFLTFPCLGRLVNCIASPSVSMSHEKKKEKKGVWGWWVNGVGGQYEESNGRLVWLSSAVAVETKQMNCAMDSKRLETSACQQLLHLSSFPPPILQDPSLSISPLFLSDILKKTGMTAVLRLSKTLKTKCNPHPFCFYIRYSGRHSVCWAHINCETLHDEFSQY